MAIRTEIVIRTNEHGNCILNVTRNSLDKPRDKRTLVDDEHHICEADALKRVAELFDLAVVPVTTTQVAGFRLVEVAP